MKIGNVARQAGIGIETIRYYERQGLLDEPVRRPSGYRQYDESIIARLRFIRRAKGLGFTLSEIRELLSLWFERDASCCEVRRRALSKITEIEERIVALQGMKRSLKKLITKCERRGSLSACPLLEGLEDGDRKPLR